MKANVQMMTAGQIIDEFDVVRMDGEDLHEVPVDKCVSYLDRDGNLCEGGKVLMTAKSIADKIDCTGVEVIAQGGRYALMMWQENN